MLRVAISKKFILYDIIFSLKFLVMLTLKFASYFSAKEKQVSGFCLPITYL